MELLKLLSANELVAQIICFLALFFILRGLLWKKFLKVLDDRKDMVAAELASIQTTKADVETIKRDYAHKITAIEDEAALKIRLAIEEAHRQGNEIRRKADEDGVKILETARENIKAEVLKAKEGLKDEIVALTIDIAGKVIAEKLSVDQDKKLVQDFIKEAGSAK